MSTGEHYIIAHLSDLHLTARDDENRAELNIFTPLRGMNAAFRKIVQSKSIQNANLVIITGDVTDTGDLEAWKVFWTSVDKAGIKDKLLVLPGNHDAGCLGLGRKYGPAGMAKAVAGLAMGNQPVKFPWYDDHRDARLVIIGLNSINRYETRITGTSGGELTIFEMVRFADLLYKFRAVPIKIVALHHSPNILQKETALRRRLKTLNWFERATLEIPQPQRQMLRLLCISHRVRLVVHGHIHQAEDRRVGGLRIVGTPASTEPSIVGNELEPACHFLEYTIHWDGDRIIRKIISEKI